MRPKLKQATVAASSVPIDSGSAKSKMHDSDIPSATDVLISQLLDHVHQGRIFDARSTVMKLYAAENEDHITCTSNLDSVRHVMDEVITQSQHVESLLSELHSDDNWTLAKHKSGVTVHFRREPNSSIHTVRAATTFDNFSPKDFVRFCSLFVETELMHLWFPGYFLQPATLLSWHSKYSKVIHLRINLGIPMMSSRDTVVLGNGYHLPDRNAFLISTKTILEDSCRYCKIPKPEKGVVRMFTESIFFVQLVKRNAILFKMIGRDDLKLKYMPTAVVNYISQGHLPFQVLKTIHRTIRNFEGTMWEEKIKERGEYYTEIESKVYDQLEKWEKEGSKTIDSDDLYREDNRSKNIEILERGKYYTDNKALNCICVWGEKSFIGLSMLSILSVLIELLPNAVNLLCNDSKPYALMVMSFSLLVLAILQKSRVKKESNENTFADQRNSFKPVNDLEEEKDNDTLNDSLPIPEFQGTADLSSFPQSTSGDTLQERPTQTFRAPATSQRNIGKLRSKLTSGIKGWKKVVPLHGKVKTSITKA